MSLLKTIINIAAPVPEIESFDRYLFIGPHPDDLEIAAGATIAKLADMGKKICILICIDGRFGTANSDYSPEEMIEIRKKESMASANYLGVKDVRFLGFCDGGLYEYENLTDAIAKEIGDFKPDIVFCPDPDVVNECHIDHLNVGRAVKTIAYLAPYYNLMREHGAESADVKAIGFFYTGKPNKFVKVKGYLDKQLSSIFDCHVSQAPRGSEDEKTFTTYIKLKYYYYGCKEGFRVLGRTQMHCLPEAGN